MLGFMGVDTPTVSEVSHESIAYESGLREGDVITNVAGVGIVFDRELTRELQKHTSDSFDITYERDGVSYTAKINPIKKQDSIYKIGAALGEDASISSIFFCSFFDFFQYLFAATDNSSTLPYFFNSPRQVSSK